MKKVVVITFIITVLILISGFYIFLNKGKTSPTSLINNIDSNKEQTKNNQFIKSNPDISVLKAGGSSYKESNDLYTLLYHNDYSIDGMGTNRTRLYKRGATQKGQTEIYDGVIIEIESVDLKNQKLTDFVDMRIKESTQDGTSKVIDEKVKTYLGAYPGFTYKLQGLGETRYLVIQKNSDSNYALVITYLVADPEQKDYQSEVEATLSTLEITK